MSKIAPMHSNLKFGLTRVGYSMIGYAAGCVLVAVLLPLIAWQAIGDVFVTVYYGMMVAAVAWICGVWIPVLELRVPLQLRFWFVWPALAGAHGAGVMYSLVLLTSPLDHKWPPSPATLLFCCMAAVAACVGCLIYLLLLAKLVKPA